MLTVLQDCDTVTSGWKVLREIRISEFEEGNLFLKS